MDEEQEVTETKEEVVEEQPEVIEDIDFTLDIKRGAKMLGLEDY